jgi:hypothetical protein
MVPHLENSLHLMVEGKTILYHLCFLSWDWKYFLGSSLEKKRGKRNHAIKISRLDRGSLTSIRLQFLLNKIPNFAKLTFSLTKISNRISGWKSNLFSQAGYNNIDQNCG